MLLRYTQLQHKRQNSYRGDLKSALGVGGVGEGTGESRELPVSPSRGWITEALARTPTWATWIPNATLGLCHRVNKTT